MPGVFFLLTGRDQTEPQVGVLHRDDFFFLHRLYLYSVSVFLSLFSFFVSVSTY